MNTSRPLSNRSTVRAARWPFAPLQRVIDTAGLASVDLTDTIFAAPRDFYEAPAAEPVPRPAREDADRLMPWRLA